MPIDVEEYRAQSREGWARVSPAWEARREWMTGVTAPVFDWLVEKADPQPGQTFLDIAGGTGDLGLRVAEAVGDEGRVILTDLTQEMLEAARRTGESRGIDNVEYRTLDAEKMDLEDGSVDGATCRWGYMLMADPGAALKETRRVVRDGGPLAFAVWTSPDRNPWVAFPGMTLVQRGVMPPPDPDAPGMFALGDQARLHELVTAAGFGDPQVEEIRFEFRYADDDYFWETLVRLAGGVSTAIAELDDDEREATRAAVIDSMTEFRREDGSYAVPASSWGVLAR